MRLALSEWDQDLNALFGNRLNILHASNHELESIQQLQLDVLIRIVLMHEAEQEPWQVMQPVQQLLHVLRLEEQGLHDSGAFDDDQLILGHVEDTVEGGDRLE